MGNTLGKAEQKAEQKTPAVPLFRSAVPQRNSAEQKLASIRNNYIICGTVFLASGTRPSLCHHPRFLERGGVEQRNSGVFFGDLE